MVTKDEIAPDSECGTDVPAGKEQGLHASKSHATRKLHREIFIHDGRGMPRIGVILHILHGAMD